MDNGHNITILNIILYSNGPILTFSEAYLFVSLGSMPYPIFAVIVDFLELFKEILRSTCLPRSKVMEYTRRT